MPVDIKTILQSGLSGGGGSAATPTTLGTVYGTTLDSGLFTTALGNGAGNSLTTGSNNCFIGYRSGFNSTTSLFNTAVGAYSLNNNISGLGNTAVGYSALQSITNGDVNTAVGISALASLTNGAHNLAVGYFSLNNSTGSFNTALGSSALLDATTGSNNVAIGYYAGVNLRTGSNNLIIGNEAQASSASVSNENTFGNSSSTSNRFWGDFKLAGSNAGTSGQVLTSAGAGTSPTWTTPASGGASSITINNKTSAYTVIAGDLGTIINCTAGTFTVSLTAAATLGSGFNVTIWNTGTGIITIDPSGSETVDGVSTLILRRGEGTQIICSGTNWNTGNKKTMRGYAENISTGESRPIASNTNSIAIGSAAQATGEFSVAIGSDTTASATRSTAIGRFALCQGSDSVVLGFSRASDTNSFAATIGSDAGFYGAINSGSVAIGQLSKAAQSATCVGGTSNSASGPSSAVFGGSANEANQSYSYAFGFNARSSVYGKYAYASGMFGSNGDAQKGLYVLRAATTNGTSTILTTDNTTAGATDQIILPDNSAFAFTGTIVARQQASQGTASAAWKVEGLIRREGSAGTTVLVNSATTVIDNTPGWNLVLTADSTNGGLAVTFTGASGTNIRAVATIETSEIIY